MSLEHEVNISGPRLYAVSICHRLCAKQADESKAWQAGCGRVLWVVGVRGGSVCPAGTQGSFKGWCWH